MRRWLFLIAACLLACASVHASSLVGYWKFDDGAGTIALDASGNGNHGELINNPTWVEGFIGGALSFDGIDDYVIIPDAPSLDISGTGITFCAWIYSPGFHNYGYIMGKAQLNGPWGDMVWWLLPKSDGAIRYAIKSGGTTHEQWDIPVGLTTDEWQHVAVVYDGSYMRFYRNGIELDNYPKTGNLDVNDGPVVIGIDAWTTTSYYLGMIDEVRIYDRALTPKELNDLYIGCSYDGDANCDGMVNVGDVVYMINFIFKDGPSPGCP